MKFGLGIFDWKRTEKEKKDIEKSKQNVKAAFGTLGRTFGFLAESFEFSDFLEDYKSHIHTCVSLTAEAVASKEWHFHDRKGIVENYELNSMLREPSMKTDWHSLCYATVASLELTGNSYWLPDKKFDKIFYIPPDRIKFTEDNKGRRIGYTINTSGSKEDKVRLRDVIHFKYVDPSDIEGYGYGPVQALEDVFDKYEDITDYEKTILDNMGIVSVVLEGGETKDQIQRMITLWEQQYAGKKQAGKIAGVPSGWKAKPGVGFSPKDMDFTNIKKSVKEEIYQIMKVPQLLVGITEKVNRSNMYQAKLVFEDKKVNPIAKLIQRSVNRYLVENEGVEFRFNYSMPRDPEVELKRDRMHLEEGVESRNEIRERRGRLPYEGGDTIYGALNEAPIADASDLMEEQRSVDSGENQKKIKKAPLIQIDWEDRGHKIWNIFKSWHDPLESKMRDSLNSTWKWLGRKTASNLSDMAPPKQNTDADLLASMAIISEEDIAGEFADRSNQQIEEAIRRVAIQTAGEVGIEISESYVNQFVLNHLETLQETWQGIAGTDIKQLQTIIEEGLDEGKNINAIARDISRKYNPTSTDYMNRRRAEAIARTETSTKAASKTRHEILMQSAAQIHYWFSSQDAKVRAAHAAAHMQEVPIDQPFSVGGEALMRPGDPAGSAANVINCRCLEMIKKTMPGG